MKRMFITFALLGALASYGQSNAPDPSTLKVVKEHYAPAFGILAAGNLDKFRVADYANLDYNAKLGWGLGIWANLPVGKAVSFEPQVMYNAYKYYSEAPATLIKEGNAGYLSIPVLVKFHFGEYLALTAGPQFDFLMSVNDNTNVTSKEDLTSTSIAGNFGLEVLPHGRLTPFARYIHGFTNMDQTEATSAKFFNENFQLGLKYRLAGGKHYYADSDGDGVADKDDQCPDQPGFARYKGCPIPDTDKDGIHDEADKCPTVAGLAKYNGCPIPDTDGDGINDEQDKCPAIAGLAKYNGCPIPDTDGDGINDEEDRCPDIAGVAEMKGCPKIDYQAHEVTFATGKAALTAAGKKELDMLANFLTNNPNVNITLDGYTDNTGSDKVNIPLSEKRAGSAKTYLVSKGITESRIATAGHGSTNPVADNKTAAGRAKNRRIEVTVQ